MESQQTETVARSAYHRETADEVEQRQKRESLQLSRARISRELEAARTPVHRAALENALKFLEDELKKA